MLHDAYADGDGLCLYYVVGSSFAMKLRLSSVLCT
jgi:hypothetical protein